MAPKRSSAGHNPSAGAAALAEAPAGDTPRLPRAGSSMVAQAAAASVEGYLRNASRRLRVPTAEGGRGTRRRLEMVTSKVTRLVDSQPGAEKSEESKPDLNNQIGTGDVGAAVNGEDESDWDDVELPSVAAASPKSENKTVKSEPAQSTHEAEVEVAGNGEVTGLAPGHVNGSTGAKEEVDVDEVSAQEDFITGSRAPLSEQPARRSWGSARDPAYAAMLEQRDLLSAKRRSERIERASHAIMRLVFLVQRGVRLYRQSHHRFFSHCLLRLRSAEPWKSEVVSSETGEEGGRWRRSGPPLLLHAVRNAQQHVAQAANPGSAKPTLGPSWITRKTDGVKNSTSAAINELLMAMSKMFFLDLGASDGEAMREWAAPIELGLLNRMLGESAGLRHHRSGFQRRQKSREASEKLPRLALPHSLYFCVIFLNLARLCGLVCRLVIAQKETRVSDKTGPRSGAAVESEASRVGPEPISIFGPATRKRKRDAEVTATPAPPPSLPASCFWVEVWCSQRQCYVSVNPCESCTTVWGAPYSLAFGGGEVVDVTPRYISKYSTAFASRLNCCSQLRFIWRHLSWQDTRDGIEVLLEPFNADLLQSAAVRREREAKQLSFLKYSEPVPTTLTALKRHPLFVVESDLPRAEAVYPRDSTTIVGSVKAHVVYKRSAVVSLRSRDGWLREGRSLLTDEEQPYKTMPPPASRPFVQNSCFYGYWQTKPFEPLPLCSDGSFPTHGRTNWYIVLSGPPAPGIAHISRPMITRVARRVQVDFRVAVTGFTKRHVQENRRGHWEVVTDGIVVRQTDAPMLLHAYDEWIRLTAEQEAAKRRQRAFHWWMLFAQRLLAVDRMTLQYLQGIEHGALPSF